MARRRISIFGSTGSIGRNTVRLVEQQGGACTYNVVALTGAANIELLAAQAKALDADLAVTARPDLLGDLRELLTGFGVECAAGEDAIADAAARETDWSMSAISGIAGFMAGYRCLSHGGVLALANKESMVAAGTMMHMAARENGAELIPVDSEHSAIFQVLRGEAQPEVDRILLTASGGPFLMRDIEALRAVTPCEAASHPNWEMGQRISIDSANLFNKALEMVEARELFGFRPDQIEVVIHPQSIVHSIVGFRDGSHIAQLGPPDMRGAIGFALNWPDRKDLKLERLDLAAIGRLDFEQPDETRFPSLRLAREVLLTGGSAGAAFIASKEAAVDAFVDGSIGFLEIAVVVERVLNDLGRSGELAEPCNSPDDLAAIDKLARTRTHRFIARGESMNIGG